MKKLLFALALLAASFPARADFNGTNGFITLSIPAVGLNGTTAPTSTIQVGGVDGLGDLVPVQMTPAGEFEVDSATADTILNAIKTNQTNATQKAQRVDGSGNVSPAGDTNARGMFVKPGDGTNVQGYTASSEAKVLVTPLSSSSTVTVVQPTGTNLHAVLDSGTTTVTQTTGTNLHTVVDSSALPTGASTSALQTTGNTSLSTIATNTGKQPINTTASGTTGTVSTVITLTAPANAVGFLLTNLDTSGANLRWAQGRTATTTVGAQLQPGRDSGFIPSGANVSLVSESGTNGYDIAWVSQ